MQTKIKNIYKKIILSLPKPISDKLYSVYYSIKYKGSHEKYVEFGELNPKQFFYVIRPRPNSVEGLMSLFLYVIQQIDYAESKGYIPIVDFKNYKTQYSVSNNENVWEMFFKQICPKSLDEIYNSKNVFLSGIESISKVSKGIQTKSFNTEDLNLARKYIQKYIRISDDVKRLYEKEVQRFIPDDTIGLYLRGTDYIRLKPTGEFVQPEVEDVIKYVNDIISKSNINKIFLVTEDYDIYKKVKDYFGDNIITVSYDSFISGYKSDDFLARDTYINQLGFDPYIRGRNYLVKILLLSKCRYIIGGKTCGSWAACAFSEETKNIHVFELGTY